MFYTVGYQVMPNFDFVNCVIENKNRVKEIYFSWEDIPNARNSELFYSDMPIYEIRRKKTEELRFLSQNGIKTNLLLNGNCYGRSALSRTFFLKIGDTIDYLKDMCLLSSVTTTSPLIAKFIKENFDDIKVRSSVNMELGTVESLSYIKDLFDGFYLKRELNRDLKSIVKIKYWCDKNGKKLYALANSGCLNFCSARTFHDNLVAHEDKISQMDNAYKFEGQCYNYLKSPETQKEWLRITNFIRPEDVHLYENLFDGMKLATRVNQNPVAVVNGYCKERFSGAIHNLLEPNHSALFYPKIIENNKIDDGFAEKVLNCDKNCDKCNFCRKVQENAEIELS